VGATEGQHTVDGQSRLHIALASTCRPRPLLRRAMGQLTVVTLTLVGLAAAASPAGAACAGPQGDAYSTAVLADGPIAYYRLDELAGETMCDSSASGANGTYRNVSTVLLTQGVPGALTGTLDRAVRGNGAVNGVAEGGPGLTGNHSYTFEGWFRSTGTKHVQQLVNMGKEGEGNIAGLGVKPSEPAGSEVILDEFKGVNFWPTAPVDLFDTRPPTRSPPTSMARASERTLPITLSTSRRATSGSDSGSTNNSTSRSSATWTRSPCTRRRCRRRASRRTLPLRRRRLYRRLSAPRRRR
jgi:hypothetical protein